MEIPQEILRILDHFGDTPSYLVGGWVRDALLGYHSMDVDIATEIEPEALKDLFRQESPLVNQYGIAFERDGYHFELTTMRQEVFHKQARHPDVYRFIRDPKIDSMRRDFTVNALYMNRFGHVFDYHGGLDDLKQGYLRFIGEARVRIQEDPVRIVRMIRFASHYNFEIVEFPSSLEVESALQQLPLILYRKDIEKCLQSEHFAVYGERYAFVFEQLFEGILEAPLFTWNLEDVPNRIDLRLSAFLHHANASDRNDKLVAVLSKLHYKKKDIRNICKWIAHSEQIFEPRIASFQKIIAQQGIEWVYDLVSLQVGLGNEAALSYASILKTIQDEHLICSYQDLNITASDIMNQGISHKYINSIKESLFEAVVEHKIENTNERLLLEVQNGIYRNEQYH